MCITPSVNYFVVFLTWP